MFLFALLVFAGVISVLMRLGLRAYTEGLDLEGFRGLSTFMGWAVSLSSFYPLGIYLRYVRHVNYTSADGMNAESMAMFQGGVCFAFLGTVILFR